MEKKNNNTTITENLNDSIESINSYLALKESPKEIVNNNTSTKKGGYKKVDTLIATTNKQVKNKKLISFQQKNKNEAYLMSAKELIFYAFLQVLDKNSPKIISPSIQTYVGENLSDKLIDENHKITNNKYILYTYFLYSLMYQHNVYLKDGIPPIIYDTMTQEFKECKDSLIQEFMKIINDNYNNIDIYHYKYKDSGKNSFLNNADHFYNKVCKKIFKEFNIILYNDNNDTLTKEEKENIFDSFTQLFFLILFLNKSDIKPENAILSNDNKIINIDPLVSNNGKYDCFFSKIEHVCMIQNKAFLSVFFNTIVNTKNTSFCKYLKQYTLNDDKIRAIIRQATENLQRGEGKAMNNETNIVNSYTDIIKSHLYKFEKYINDNIIRLNRLIKKEKRINIKDEKAWNNLQEVLENNKKTLQNFLNNEKQIKETVELALQRQKEKIENNKNNTTKMDYYPCYCNNTQKQQKIPFQQKKDSNNRNIMLNRKKNRETSNEIQKQCNNNIINNKNTINSNKINNKSSNQLNI